MANPDCQLNEDIGKYFNVQIFPDFVGWFTKIENLTQSRVRAGLTSDALIVLLMIIGVRRHPHNTVISASAYPNDRDAQS